jgi:hypothetical protein
MGRSCFDCAARNRHFDRLGGDRITSALALLILRCSNLPARSQ